jgi:hypothetical protein
MTEFGELERIGEEAAMISQGTIPTFAWRNRGKSRKHS